MSVSDLERGYMAFLFREKLSIIKEKLSQMCLSAVEKILDQNVRNDTTQTPFVCVDVQ